MSVAGKRARLQRLVVLQLYCSAYGGSCDEPTSLSVTGTPGPGLCLVAAAFAFLIAGNMTEATFRERISTR